MTSPLPRVQDGGSITRVYGGSITKHLTLDASAVKRVAAGEAKK